MKLSSSTNNYYYNKQLQPYARKLRNNGTKAEACLWKYVLRAGELKKYKFRRQRPVLNFIADFMCFELMLVIEVDGYTHLLEETIRKDEKKTRMLEEIGFAVIRFADDEVLKNIENVQRELEAFVGEFEKGKTDLD